MSNKKIMYIHWLYKPYVVGGGETYLENLIEYQLKNTSNRIILLTSKPFKNFKDLFPAKYQESERFIIYRYYPLNIYFGGNTNNKPFIFKVVWYFFNIWNIHQYLVTKKVLEIEKPDFVHLTSSHSGAVFSAIKKYRTLLTIHAYELIPYPFLKSKKKNILVEIYIKIKRFQTRQINTVIFPSKFISNYHSTYKFFPKSQKHVIYNGINIPSKVKLKDTYMSKDIVFMGQLEEYKGLRVLIEWALKYINDYGYILHILGKGSMGQYIKDVIPKNDNIIFEGFIDNNRRFNILSSAKFFILPSIFLENNPMSILESLSFGTPVIANNVGGVSELIKDDETGFLINDLNIINLNKTIKRISLMDERRYNNMKKKCFDLSKEYSIDQNMKKVLELYK